MSVETSLKFGTSGLRGLVEDLQGDAARRYTAAFLRHLSDGSDSPVRQVFLGRDLRPSSPAILRDCAIAIADAGLAPVDCGALPTPALALHAMAAGGAAIMVTGSHIPADRNGLKFYSPRGEISKADETGILAALGDAAVPDRDVAMADEADAATDRYFRRYAGLLPEGALAGKRIGVFEHSSVARDLLNRLLRHFEAEVVSLGRTDEFVPVDTEAFSDAVFAPLAGWVAEYSLDAVVSADGDGDRPLLMDASGGFVRGDALGLLAAQLLGAQCVVTPVTSNSAIDSMGFHSVRRTRVGSPYVVAAMAESEGPAVGFEANGGTLIGKGVAVGGHDLPELATRDAVLPLLTAVGMAAADGVSVRELVGSLPLKHALADRLQNVPGEKSGAFLLRLAAEPDYAAQVFAPYGIAGLSDIDGLQFRTLRGAMVHFRASGNAPELRCYVEADDADEARTLLDWAMGVAARETA